MDPGEAGIRVSGNINIAALHVVNAANIQVQGESKGIPVTATVNTGALTSASSAASSATQRSGDDAATAGIRAPEPAVHHLGADPLRQRAGIWIVRGGRGAAGQPPRRDGSASGYDPRSVFQMLGNGDIPEAQRAGSRTPNGAGCRRLKRASFLSRGSHTPLLHCLFTDRHRVRRLRPAGRGGALARQARGAPSWGSTACVRVGYVLFEGGSLHAHRYGAAPLAALLLLAACCWRAGRGGAARASAIFAFDIPAQPLQAALEQYSNVTGGSVVYRAALTVGGVRPP